MTLMGKDQASKIMTFQFLATLFLVQDLMLKLRNEENTAYYLRKNETIINDFSDGLGRSRSFW